MTKSCYNWSKEACRYRSKEGTGRWTLKEVRKEKDVSAFGRFAFGSRHVPKNSRFDLGGFFRYIRAFYTHTLHTQLLHYDNTDLTKIDIAELERPGPATRRPKHLCFVMRWEASERLLLPTLFMWRTTMIGPIESCLGRQARHTPQSTTTTTQDPKEQE